MELYSRNKGGEKRILKRTVENFHLYKKSNLIGWSSVNPEKNKHTEDHLRQIVTKELVLDKNS